MYTCTHAGAVHMQGRGDRLERSNRLLDNRSTVWSNWWIALPSKTAVRVHSIASALCALRWLLCSRPVHVGVLRSLATTPQSAWGSRR